MSEEDIESRIIELAKQLRKHIQKADIDPESDAAAEAVIYEIIDQVALLEDDADPTPRFFN